MCQPICLQVSELKFCTQNGRGPEASINKLSGELIDRLSKYRFLNSGSVLRMAEGPKLRLISFPVSLSTGCRSTGSELRFCAQNGREPEASINKLSGELIDMIADTLLQYQSRCLNGNAALDFSNIHHALIKAFHDGLYRHDT